MTRISISFLRLIPIFLFILNLTHGSADANSKKNPTAHHDLEILLFPDEGKMEGRDRIRIEGSEAGPLHLFLSPRAHIKTVQIDGRESAYTFNKGHLILKPKRSGSSPSVDLTICYTCRFDDPAPVQPVNTDNPGFGVSGTISPAGTFLLSGAGWYPHIPSANESFDLRVDGPKDTVAVTAGQFVGIDHLDKRTVSLWHINKPVEGLSLSAGPYVIERQQVNGITAATYLFSKNRDLSSRYLHATGRYLKRYSDLFGSYPFDGFAVVENFFPTGYGFPSYTLMGGVILRLPFIPETSLPHEIVHSWWGNGVWVDAASGNWCEGLTSYTADYFNKEQDSPEAAMDYRRQALRSYASLVSPKTDFPLSRFQHRIDPVTKAVGYDKSAMVFHMLRQVVGDANFWRALRGFYAEFLFKRASWQDLQHAFELQAGRPLDRFFQQWIQQPGAPQLRLEAVQYKTDNGEYRISGHLVQEKPYYDVTLNLILDTKEGAIEQTVALSGREMDFEILTNDRPSSLTADPDYHLFRRLTPDEMPPTVNTLKGSKSVVLVISDRMGRFGAPIAQRFIRAMGLQHTQTVREEEFTLTDAEASDLLFIGLPENQELIRLLPRDLELSPNTFQVAGERFDESIDLLFIVARQPENKGKIISLIHPLSPEHASRVTLKIPHYGRYSYLAFSDGRNRAKGTWEVHNSPMMVRWK